MAISSILTEWNSIEKLKIKDSISSYQGIRRKKGELAMGYILPIQHDTYIQYANRSVPVQKHYSHTLPTTAVQSISNFNREEPFQQQHQFADILEQKKRILKNNQNSGQFFGKGKQIDQFI